MLGNIRRDFLMFVGGCFMCHVLGRNFSGSLLAALNHSYSRSSAPECKLMIQDLLCKIRKLAREKKYSQLIHLGHERGQSINV